MTSRAAPAKINLALVVGPLRTDGKHELTTVYDRIGLADRVELEPADTLLVEGFPEDTLVARALAVLAVRAGVPPAWRVRLRKEIPVAAGLGGGSSDAAAALLLANATLPEPLDAGTLHGIATQVGADLPFFLTDGPQLGEEDGTRLTALRLPRDYAVLVLLPHGVEKASTADVYRAFDARGGATGFEERRAALLEALAAVRSVGDLAGLPANDLASSPLSAEIVALGAFRADVSGAGPAVYGLFEDEASARSAARALAPRGRTWVAFPPWYG